MIKTHVHIAVEIPLADPTNKLLIEPGTNGYVVLSNGAFKVGVNKELLKEALMELELMRFRHSLPEERKEVPAPAMGEIIEGDDDDLGIFANDDIPF